MDEPINLGMFAELVGGQMRLRDLNGRVYYGHIEVVDATHEVLELTLKWWAIEYRGALYYQGCARTEKVNLTKALILTSLTGQITLVCHGEARYITLWNRADAVGLDPTNILGFPNVVASVS